MIRRLRHHGFTMIEMVITIVILGIIAGIAAIMLAGGVDAYLAGERVMANAPAARLAMDRTLLELKAACRGGITVSNSQVNYFFPNPDCNDSPASHAIRLFGSDLQLQVAAGGPWFPLARDVSQINNTNPVFTLSTDPNSGCQTITIQFQISSATTGSLPIRSAVFLENQPCTPPAT